MDGTDLPAPRPSKVPTGPGGPVVVVVGASALAVAAAATRALPAPTVAAWADPVGWIGARGPIAVAGGLACALIAAVGAWCVVVGLLGTLAVGTRARWPTRVLARLAPPSLAALVLGASMAVGPTAAPPTTATGVHTVGLGHPGAAVRPTLELVDPPPRARDGRPTLALVDPPPAPADPRPTRPPAEEQPAADVDPAARRSGPPPPAPPTPVPAPPTPSALPAPAAGRPVAPAPSAPDGSTTWVIAPGEHLWAVAEAVTRSVGTTDPAAVAGYHRRLVAANQAALPVPGQPDLVFPGTIIACPPVEGR